MQKVLTFDLGKRIPAGAALQFLRAEIPDIPDPPVALIRYSMGGHESETGLRLDLDKQVFLDHFDTGSKQERDLLRAVPRLIRLLYAELDKREGIEPDESDEQAAPVSRWVDDSPLVESPAIGSEAP